MIRYLLIGFIVLVNSYCFAQYKIILGRVNDKDGKPLAGVTLCQKPNNCKYTDLNGKFIINVEKDLRKPILINYFGYEPLTIRRHDTINSPLLITMEIDTSDIALLPDESYRIYTDATDKVIFIPSFNFDYLPRDFSEFENVLGKYNIDMINSVDITYGLKLTLRYRRYSPGFNFGLAYGSNTRNDSLDMRFSMMQFGPRFGYNLIDTKRFSLTPEVEMRWCRYRVSNNIKDTRIPIDQYVKERDLDIRFNQMTGNIGLDFAFKTARYNSRHYDNWAIGLYGGYAFKLNDKPWIYSRWNRLTSDGKINMDHYYIGVYISMYAHDYLYEE